MLERSVGESNAIFSICAHISLVGRHYHVLLPWGVIVVVAAGYGTSVLIDYVFITSPSFPSFPNFSRTSGSWIALHWDAVSLE